MSPEEWVGVVEREYLGSFVRQGGAAVKFAAAATAGGRVELRERLTAAAAAHGFQFVMLDATEVRLHFIEQLFHAVARQVDWDRLAWAFVERLLRSRGLRLPPLGEPVRSSGSPSSTTHQRCCCATICEELWRTSCSKTTR